jgi:hypothetical protein
MKQVVATITRSKRQVLLAWVRLQARHHFGLILAIIITTMSLQQTANGLDLSPDTLLKRERSSTPSGSNPSAGHRRQIKISVTRDESLPLELLSGIREVIPAEYKKRYEGWKNELISTQAGRRQWETNAQNKGFILTIAVSPVHPHDAAVGNFRWNGSGDLIAATITLGCRIDEAYPPKTEYPVTNSLELFESVFMRNGGPILAAAKIAHEFGHVNQRAGKNASLYRLQDQLTPLYNSILLSNGHNTRDPQLVELARQMGATPVGLWEDSEYWGEASAMLYLRDKIRNRAIPCSIFTRIKQNLEFCTKSYAERFALIVRSNATLAPCTSQRLPRLIAKQ